MVFQLLVDTPLSSAYDFIGDLPRRSWRTGRIIREEQEPIEEETIVEEPKEQSTDNKDIVEEVREEKVDNSKIEEGIPVEEESSPLPEPSEIIEETPVPVNYIELDYDSIDRSNPKSSLPVSEQGNYIIVYRTDNCPYCEKVISEFRGKSEAYILVVIRCKNAAIDLYYNRFVYNFPSWVIISQNRVTYYGNGYYTWESFKRMLKE